MTEGIDRFHVGKRLRLFQDTTVELFTKTDGKGYYEEIMWNRPNGGGGSTLLFRNSNVFEKAGIDSFEIHGDITDSMNLVTTSAHDFFASGITLSFHPHNPAIPTLIMHTTYLELTNGDHWLKAGFFLLPNSKTLNKEKYTRWFEDANALYKGLEFDASECIVPHRNKNVTDFSLIIDQNLGQITLGQVWPAIETLLYQTRSAYQDLVIELKASPIKREEKQIQKENRGLLAEYLLTADKDVSFRRATGCPTQMLDMILPPDAIWN